MSKGLSQSTFVVEMQHKYAIGDKVRVVNHRYNGAEGVVVARIPWMLIAPGYDVEIDGVIMAVSERSLARIETPEPEYHS